MTEFLLLIDSTFYLEPVPNMFISLEQLYYKRMDISGCRLGIEMLDTDDKVIFIFRWGTHLNMLLRLYVVCQMCPIVPTVSQLVPPSF